MESAKFDGGFKNGASLSDVWGKNLTTRLGREKDYGSVFKSGNSLKDVSSAFVKELNLNPAKNLSNIDTINEFLEIIDENGNGKLDDNELQIISQDGKVTSESLKEAIKLIQDKSADVKNYTVEEILASSTLVPITGEGSIGKDDQIKLITEHYQDFIESSNASLEYVANEKNSAAFVLQNDKNSDFFKIIQDADDKYHFVHTTHNENETYRSVSEAYDKLN